MELQLGEFTEVAGRVGENRWVGRGVGERFDIEHGVVELLDDALGPGIGQQASRLVGKHVGLRQRALGRDVEELVVRH